MSESDTDTLRKLAPCWTLAGDERLLSILQDTHQKLISRCQDTNTQLEQMANALDEASISLQNVNNQFMALSSSQFIERRVYDDDLDITTETPVVKETPKLSAPDDISMLKRSISVLENSHEVITILHDSDTDSDTDDDTASRLVMKPRDMYSDRPLPYIIGSEPWKSKWHAGLLAEDSDTDSSTSKVERQSEQYSQSEPEEFDEGLPQPHGVPSMGYGRELSESSSEVASEPTPHTLPTPADVASEIARRLGGGDPPPKVVNHEPEYDESPKPAVRTVYKPQEPIASTIFPDEPPPIDYQTDSDTDKFAELNRKQPYNQPYSRQEVSDELFRNYDPCLAYDGTIFPDEPPPIDYQTDSDTDIFAELNRKQPYNQPYSRQEVSDELFGNGRDSDGGGDIFSDFGQQPSTSKPVSIFEAGPTPHMFDKQRQMEQRPPRIDRPDIEQPVKSTADADSGKGVKKPVGGISLFGSNSGAVNIGAAILKRNQRKSSSSEENENDSQSHTSPIKDQQAKKEKDIFDDLFAKSETKKVIPKDKIPINKKEDHKIKETVKKDTPKPIDLFSDNLFDDIDDIFTTSVVKSSSIFDDEDDLFSGISETKPAKDTPKKGGLFDSDDDLFSEKIPKQKPLISSKPKDTASTSADVTETSEKSKSIEHVDRKINEKPNITSTTTPIANKPAVSIFNDEEDDIFSNVQNKNVATKVENIISTAKTVDIKKNVVNSPLLFDDDDDESDLFTENNKLKDNKQKIKLDSKGSDETTSTQHEKSADLSGNDRLDVTTDISTAKADIKKDVSDKPVPAARNKIINKIPSKPDVQKVERPTNFAANVLKKQVDTDQNSFKDLRSNHDETVEDLDTTRKSDEPKPIDDSTSKSNEVTSTNVIENVSADRNNEDLISKTMADDNLTTTSHELDRILENKPVKDSSNSKNIENDFDLNTANINVEEAPKNIQKTIEDIIEEPPEFDDVTDITPTSDIFANIVSEPPDFEKPKEPKKSKNVNALFDDDSDDETLFFKREDAITDEKPEDFTVKQDRLFDIFTTEPPDEDFSHIDNNSDDDLVSALPKPKLPDKQIAANIIYNNVPIANIEPSTNNKILANESNIKPETPKPDFAKNKENESDIFVTDTKIDRNSRDFDSISGNADSMVTQPESLKNTITEMLLSDDEEDLFKSLPVKFDDSKAELKSKITDNLFTSDDDLFKSLPPNLNKVEIPQPTLSRSVNILLPTEPESLDPILKVDNVEGKKVGKLKVGLNINVNALLPGASPKKVKPVDTIESPIETPKETYYNPLSPGSSPKRVKILDNNDGLSRIDIQKEINVNALLPGASPKKVKLVDNIDGQSQSQVEIQKDIQRVTKHISFEEEPESKVLDSKLSKERPRIQVKRRPSSRKARKEAVRKSGIDFGEDSTDNSSSVDDSPKILADTVENTGDPSNNGVGTPKNEGSDINNESSQEAIETKTRNLENEPFSLKEESLFTDIATEVKTESLANQTNIEPLSIPKKSDSTTKIVYILHDEDIFDTNTADVSKTDILTSISKDNITTSSEKTNITTKSTEKTNINEENTTKTTEIPNISRRNTDVDTEPIIKTLGNTYKSDKKSDNKKSKSLFGDDNHLDDDEIFRSKKPTEGDQLDNEEVFKGKKPVNKNAIFDDSDSEGELFGKSTKKEVNKMVKGSLFGDDDDGDDLFGVKTSKRVAEPQQSTKPTSSFKEPSKSTQPVFEDPLSLFGEDD